MLCICVRDSGIATDQHQFVFVRFVQADSQLDKPNEGAGLEQSISKASAKLHGGNIKLKTAKES